jgi:hypothetical protein
MPPLRDYTNWAEGVVIRCQREIALHTKKDRVRPIIKNKAKRFQEDHQVYESATKHVANRAQTEALELVTLEVQAMATSNRVQNAVSKLGPVEPEQKDRVKQLLALVIEDVTEELQNRCADECDNISRAVLDTLLANECKLAIIEYFKQVRRERRRIADATAATSTSTSSSTQ